MSEENPKKKSRREFLQQFSLFGAGTILASGAIYSGFLYQKKKKPGDRIKVLTEEGKVLEIDANDAQALSNELTLDLSELQRRGREGLPGHRWVWVIDLSKCRNARKCMSACQSAHHLRPEQHHINVLMMQESQNTAPYYMPKPCQHCDNPPCVSVCPVDATFKRPDGPVLIDNKRCIGCRFCIAACPYSARIFNWHEPLMAEEDKDKEYDVELNIPQAKGTISKCLMSSDRLREGKLPYCVSACPNGVYYFGDENEDSVTNGTTKETVRFRELIEKNAGYRLMADLGTNPRVYYLPPKDKEYPFEDKDREKLHEH